MEERIFWGCILGIAVFIVIYMLIPFILTRIWSFGVVKKAHAHQTLALTFDDGPHPEYTPQLLDLLKKYDVKATFFVLGSMAEKHPELIRRMHEEGHLIGVHNYTHRSNWLMLPWTVHNGQVRKAADAVERIIGARPGYYRPPWGIMNLFDFRLLRKFRIILWSVMVNDWRSKSPDDVERMRDQLLTQCRGGSIVLLHDSGETFGAIPEAPRYMLRALDETLAVLKPQGMRFARIDELLALDEKDQPVRESLGKRIIVKLFLGYDQLVHKVLGIRPFDDSDPFLKYRIRPYHSKNPLHLEDGPVIQRGDPIIELHLNNVMLHQLGVTSRSLTQLSVKMIRSMQHLMPLLADKLKHDPTFRDIKGIYGVSLVHRGTQKFGFSVIDLPDGLYARLTKAYLRFLLFIVHPRGKERLGTKTELLEPKIIAISREEIIRRYLTS